MLNLCLWVPKCVLKVWFPFHNVCGWRLCCGSLTWFWSQFHRVLHMFWLFVCFECLSLSHQPGKSGFSQGNIRQVGRGLGSLVGSCKSVFCQPVCFGLFVCRHQRVPSCCVQKLFVSYSAVFCTTFSGCLCWRLCLGVHLWGSTFSQGWWTLCQSLSCSSLSRVG